MPARCETICLTSDGFRAPFWPLTTSRTHYCSTTKLQAASNHDSFYFNLFRADCRPRCELSVRNDCRYNSKQRPKNRLHRGPCSSSWPVCARNAQNSDWKVQARLHQNRSIVSFCFVFSLCRHFVHLQYNGLLLRP